MTEPVGDMAGRVAGQLKEEHIRQIEEGTRSVEENRRENLSEARSLFTKIDYNWRSSDSLILDQVRAASAAVFQQEFAGVIGILNGIYAAIRTPVLNEYGIAVTDQQGRMIWMTGPNGLPIEDWNRLTGQDIESALFDLQRVKFGLSLQVNDLQSEALFAKHIYDDNYHDAYSDVVEGTVKDREARASREARQDKYFAYFRYVLWSSSDTFMKEVVNFQRLLEKTLQWNVWNNDRAGRG